MNKRKGRGIWGWNIFFWGDDRKGLGFLFAYIFNKSCTLPLLPLGDGEGPSDRLLH